jgi:adenosylhomocysteine nucleosidase
MNSDHNRNLVIILISANTEWTALRRIMPGVSEDLSPYGAWFEVDLEGYSLIFMQGGFGKISAAASTQYAISRWNPELLINLGTCGGFEGMVDRDEIILVDKTIVYDIIEQMGEPEAVLKHYSTDIDLSWLAKPYPQKVIRTLLISGDRDLLSDEVVELNNRFGAIVGDWESGAIAFVANRNATRLLILRGVSDLVGPSGGEAYGNIELFRTRTYEILSGLINNLPHWLVAAGISPGKS